MEEDHVPMDLDHSIIGPALGLRRSLQIVPIRRIMSVVVIIAIKALSRVTQWIRTIHLMMLVILHFM